MEENKANRIKKEEVIFILDDEKQILEMFRMVLEKPGRKIITASTSEDANAIIANLISEAHNNNARRPIDVAIIDLNLRGPESGSDFGKRLFDIMRDCNIIIATGDKEAAKSLSFEPDEILIKPFNSRTVIDTVEEFIAPRRISVDPPEISLNCWLLTAGLTGINSLKHFSRDVSDDNVEKMVSRTSDGWYVSFVVYPPPKGNTKEINIGVACQIGCKPGGCKFCKVWKGLLKEGKPVTWIRDLTDREIISQFYDVMVHSKRVRAALANGSNTKINFNVTCGGDAAYNLDNVCAALKQLIQVFGRLFDDNRLNCIITTIGSEKSLMEYRRRYTNVPVTFYLSVVSLDERIRHRLIPGSRGQSLEKMFDSLEIIGDVTGNVPSVSLTAIDNLTTRPENVELYKKCLAGRRIKAKVMMLVPGSLPGYSASDVSVEKICKDLKEAGVKDVRDREIFGSEYPVLAGCGNTIEKFRDIS